jgi:hypothetical protein
MKSGSDEMHLTDVTMFHELIVKCDDMQSFWQVQ